MNILSNLRIGARLTLVFMLIIVVVAIANMYNTVQIKEFRKRLI